MAELGTMKSGSHIAFILCILFLESRLHLIKAIDIPPKRLCSEDVLVLLQYLSSSPCTVTNETDINLDYRVQDPQNCLVSCDIKGSITSTSDSNSRCQCKDGCTVSDSINKEENRLTLSKQLCFCCNNSRREVNIRGYCDYKAYIDVSYGGRCTHSFQCIFAGGECSTNGACSCRSDFVYDKFNNECVSAKKLGEICESDEQCGTTFYQMQCLNNECSCINGYTILHGHCYKKFVSFGDKCMLNEQCWNHGGYCNGTCSCTRDYEYSLKNNNCIRAWNLQVGDACTSDRQCGGTGNSMNCSSGRCSCKTGYIHSHRMCLKDGLPLHTQCITSRQCSGSQFPLICDTSDRCVCSPGYIYDDSTYTCLKAWNLQVGDACTSDRQCGGTENSMICSSGRCFCKTGYIQSYRMCLKDGLPLHTQCITSRQCSGSQFPLICDTSERCVCSPGYIYDDSTYTCLKDVKDIGGPEMQQSESNQDTVVVGAAVGSGVIGVIIGVLTTLGAMFLLKRSRARRNCDTKKPPVGRHEVYEEKLQMVSKQDTYEQIGKVEEKNNTIKDVVLNSESVYHVVEPTPSAPIEDKTNKQEEESVYNHLFEKVEESEISTYDNPHEICAGRDNQAFVEEGNAQNARHDHQAFVEERMSRDTSLPEENKLAGFHRGSPNVTNENSESDDYFVLECNK